MTGISAARRPSSVFNLQKYLTTSWTWEAPYDVVLSNSTAGNITLTLPLISTLGQNYRIEVVQLVAANNTIVDLSGADVFLDGSGSQTLAALHDKLVVEAHVQGDTQTGAPLAAPYWSYHWETCAALWYHERDWQESVKTRTLDTPPGAPVNGDRYIVKSPGVGGWVGKGNYIAEWSAAVGDWLYYVPTLGAHTTIEDEGTGPTGYVMYWDGIEWRGSDEMDHAKEIAASPYTLEDYVTHLLVDSTGSDIVVNVPALTAWTDNQKVTIIKKGSANTVTISLSGGNTFLDGNNTRILTGAGDYFVLDVLHDLSVMAGEYQHAFTAINYDIDTGAEVVDSFADTLATGCEWQYRLSKAGPNAREGTVSAIWDAATDAVQYTEVSTPDIGATGDVVFSVTIAANQVTLTATAASDNWACNVIRRLNK